MKSTLVAAGVAAFIALPALAQTAPEPVTVKTEQVQVPQSAPRGSSTPTGLAAGTATAVVVVGLGIMLFIAGMAAALGGS